MKPLQDNETKQYNGNETIQQGTAINTWLAKVFNKKKYVCTFKFELKLATNERGVYNKPDQSDLP